MLPPARGESSDIYNDTATFRLNDRETSAWISDTFDGTHARQLSGEILAFAVEQSHNEGGLDVGLSSPDFYPRPVADIPEATSFCSAYEINLVGAGRWWAGPKISVNWQGDESAKGNGEDWYENYIVETASSTPQAIHDIFTGDYFKGEVLPDLTLNGAQYKNYKIRFHDWWQFWSVRQNYREEGTVSIKPILGLWAAHGLPAELRLDCIKANIETYGEMRGTGRLRIAVTTTPDASLDCGL